MGVDTGVTVVIVVEVGGLEINPPMSTPHHGDRKKRPSETGGVGHGRRGINSSRVGTQDTPFPRAVVT